MFGENGIKTIHITIAGTGYVGLSNAVLLAQHNKVYAVDIYDASIEDMEKYKLENNVDNLINIEADITKGIEEIDDNTLDVILMVNVFHYIFGIIYFCSHMGIQFSL